MKAPVLPIALPPWNLTSCLSLITAHFQRSSWWLIFCFNHPFPIPKLDFPQASDEGYLSTLPPSSISNSIHSCIFTWKPNPCVPNVRCHSKSEHSGSSGLALRTFQGRSLEKLGTLNLIRCYSTSSMVERCPIPFRCTHLPSDTLHLFVLYFTPLQKYTTHQPTIKINLKDLKTNPFRSTTLNPPDFLISCRGHSSSNICSCIHHPLLIQNSTSCHALLIPYPTQHLSHSFAVFSSCQHISVYLHCICSPS